MLRLVADGAATRTPLGDDALWKSTQSRREASRSGGSDVRTERELGSSSHAATTLLAPVGAVSPNTSAQNRREWFGTRR